MKKIALVTAILASSFALNAATFAQSTPVITPQGIVVNPVPTTLQTQVSVDRAGTNPTYFVGENVKVKVSVNQDAYVYLFSIDASGGVDLILPNRLSGGAEFMRGGETRQFPPVGANWQLTVTGPFGQDTLLAVASKRQLNLSEIATFKNGQPFATTNVQGASGLARPLALIVTPLPAQDWVTTTAQYQVRQAAVTTQPAPIVTAPPVYSSQPVVSNDPLSRYGMTMISGTSIVRIYKNDEDSFGAILNTNLKIVDLADAFRRQLEGMGWGITQAKVKYDNVRLEFRCGGQDLTLRIDRNGNGVRFSIELD